MSSLLRMVGDATGLFSTDGPDGGLGMIMSGLAGVAAALAAAIMLSVYFRTGYRSRRDVVRHSLAAAAVMADTQVELHTDRNQTLTQMQRALALDENGRSFLRGSVQLDYRTTDRVV